MDLERFQGAGSVDYIEDDLAFTDCCSAKYRDNVASNILGLITNSDLSEEDSLEVLKKNKAFMKEKEIENLDLVEEHLKEAVRTKNS